MAVRFAVKNVSFAAAGVFCLPLAAQQAIHFSKPADQGSPVTASSIEQPVSHVAPSAFNAPTPLFGGFGSSGGVSSVGVPPPVYPNPNAILWQKALQDRKNWALMTPEQILGIPTPESILGIPSRPEDANLSPEEQFLKRRDEEAQSGATNGALSSISSTPSSIWANIDDSAGAFQDSGNNNGLHEINSRQAIPDQPDNRGAFFGLSAASSAAAAPSAVSIWSSSFQSHSTPKATPKQLAGMETFRALLDSQPAQSTQPEASANPYPAPSTVTADPFIQPSPISYNPAGSAPSALESGISRPAGITPLPGITGPHIPAPTPAPSVQPPPWMSQSPKIGTLQQRQF